MPSLIFLCVANSARSQMAEGLARAGAPDGWQVLGAVLIVGSGLIVLRRELRTPRIVPMVTD